VVVVATNRKRDVRSAKRPEHLVLIIFMYFQLSHM
jgi:hypothetical protein